jgi:hypothetical protein
MRKLIIFILLFTFIFPLSALADDPPAPPELDVKKFVLDGVEYVGFLAPDAQTLLQYRIDVPKLKLEIDKLKEKITNNKLQIEKLTSANGTLLETKQFLITENVRMQKEIDTQNAWYKSPYLWFCVGLVAGTAATVTVVYLVK